MRLSELSIGFLVAALLVASCTSPGDPAPPDDSPSPTTTASPATATRSRVVFLVHPDLDGGPVEVQRAVDATPAALRTGRDVRVAVVDDPEFLVDTAMVLAQDGYDLVCLLGPGVGPLVLEVAASAPDTRFCGAPMSGGAPDNVLPIDLRFEELGYLAGVAFATDEAPGPVALVSGRSAPSGRVRDGVRAGLAAEGVGPQVSVATPIQDEEEAADRVEGLLARGTRGVLALAGPLDLAVLEAVMATPVVTPTQTPTDGETPDPEPDSEPSPSPTPEPPQLAALVGGRALQAPGVFGDLSPQALVVAWTDVTRAVELALERLDPWDPAPVSLGVADEAVLVRLNPRARSGAVAAAIERALQALHDGEVVFDE